MYCSPTWCYVLSFRVKHFFHISFSNTRDTCYYLKRREKRHPYKATGETVVLYNLIFTFFYRSQTKTRVFELNGSKCSPNLFYSWRFVNVIWICYFVPKYFKFARFSKYLVSISVLQFCSGFWWLVLRGRPFRLSFNLEWDRDIELSRHIQMLVPRPLAAMYIISL
jgi:hypothetical protein